MAVAVGRAREEKTLVLASGGGSEKLRNARFKKKVQTGCHVPFMQGRARQAV
jgi:hypothetical protein